MGFVLTLAAAALSLSFFYLSFALTKYLSRNNEGNFTEFMAMIGTIVLTFLGFASALATVVVAIAGVAHHA